MTWILESKTGSDLTGNSGDSNRTIVLALNLTGVTIDSNTIQIIVGGSVLTLNTDYTYASSTKTITFSNAVWDDENIQIQYSYTSDSVSLSNDSLRYTTIPKFNQSLLMNVTVPNRDTSTTLDNEEVGTGDNSETKFILDYGNVIEDSLTLYYGADASATDELTETTHYTVDYDAGKITLTTAGVTLLGTDTLYATYDYNKYNIPNTLINNILLEAEADFDRRVNTVFYDGTATTPEFNIVQDELLIGQGYANQVYQLNNYPINNKTTTLNGAVSADDSTITVVSTNGFPSSGYFSVENNKIQYTGKTDTTFTGCTGATAHETDKTVCSWVIEYSLDMEGTTPTWTVLTKDIDYSIDFVSGNFKLNDSYITVNSVYTDSYKPPLNVWDRVRISYQSGYDEIYNDVIKAVHLIAGQSLYSQNVMNAIARGTDGFDSDGIDDINKQIDRIVNKYRCMLINNLND